MGDYTMPLKSYPPQGHFQNVKVDTVKLTLDKSLGIGEGWLQMDIDTALPRVGLRGGEVTLNIGAEDIVARPGKNETGSLIPNGTLVILTDAVGVNIIIDLADPDTFIESQVLGMVTEDIADNQAGFITRAGSVKGTDEQPIDTSSYPEGTNLWLENNGTFSNVRPTPPRFGVFIGKVLRQHATQGDIGLRLVNAQRLVALSDVFVSGTPNDNDRFAWIAANNRFELVAGP